MERVGAACGIGGEGGGGRWYTLRAEGDTESHDDDFGVCICRGIEISEGIKVRMG